MKLLDYPELEILTTGEVVKIGFGLLKPLDNGKGYKFVSVKRDGKQRNLLIHRLVAAAYLELRLSDRQAQVNHINGNRSDNRVENLELCTPRENVNRGFARLKGLKEFYESGTIVQCRSCEKLKDISQFGPSGKRLSGYRAYCKQCESKLSKRNQHE